MRASVVLHVEADSGPHRSLAPRLARMREAGWALELLVPGEGPAASQARELGAVRTGLPGALTMPRTPAGALAGLRAQRTQRRVVGAAVAERGAALAIVSAPVMLGALAGARRAGAGTLLYCGEVLARGGARGLAGAALGRLAARRADAIVVPSRAAGAAYEGLGTSIHVVPPPIAPPPAPDELRARGARLRAELGLGPQERVVASLGAITEGRGQHLLVEALALLAARGREGALIVGGAPYQRAPDLAYSERLRALVRERGLERRVRLAGRVADPQALYAAADVFVNPATVPEGFGRGACEALACRCPVVATRTGGVPEALTDGRTALLVEPGSAAALAAAIERLLGDAALAERLAAAGAADVAERFSEAAGQPEFDRAVRAALARNGAR